jgi:hypothetical protein
MSEEARVERHPRRPLHGGRAWPAEGSAEPAGADHVQRAVEPGQSATPPAQGAQQPSASRPTAEQVADRVYELLVRDLRLENERLGR